MCVALVGCGQPPGLASRIDASTRLSLADIAAAGGDTESARTILEAAASSDPDNGGLQLRYAQALLDSGRVDDALKVAHQASERLPNDNKLALGVAQLQLRAGKAALATTTFQALAQHGAGGSAALNGLGVARVQSADLPGAEQAFRQALALAPGDYASRNNLALVLVLQGRAADAVPMLQSLANEPGIPGRVKHNLALAYAQQGDTRQAADALDGVVSGAAASREVADLTSLRAEAPTQLVQELGPAELVDGRSSGRPFAGNIPAPTTAAAQPAMPAAPALTNAAAAVPQAAEPSSPARQSEPKIVVMRPAPVGTVQSSALEQPTIDMVKPFITSGAAPGRVSTFSDDSAQPVDRIPAVVAGRPIALTKAAPAARPIMPAAATPRYATPAVAAEEPVAAAAAAIDGSVTVRFAAMPSRTDALAVWNDMAGDVPDLLNGHAPVVVAQADQDAPWAIGTGGFQDTAAAEAFCQELRARAQSCAVGL